MSVDTLLSRLDRIKPARKDRWLARCSAHDDKLSSQAVTVKDEKVLLQCFGGCSVYDVLFSIKLKANELFLDSVPGASLKSHRTPFSYADAARFICCEEQQALVAACNFVNGVVLASTDKNRLRLASQRIRHDLEVSGCGY